MTEYATPRPLHRSRDDRIFAGVCGGLAEYFDLHPAFFRVGFVVLALLGGSGILAYVAAALVIPDAGKSDSIASAALRGRRDHPWPLIGLGLVGLAALVLLSHATLWAVGGASWTLLLAAGLLILWTTRRDREVAGEPGEPSRPARPSAALPALGLLVAGGGLLGLLETLGVDIRWDVAIAVAAILLGVGTVAGALLRLRVGGLVVLAVLMGALAVVVSAVHARVDGSVGDRTYRPLAVSQLRDEYRLGIGDLKLDLGDLELPAGATRVDATLGVGQLEVVVPRGVDLRVEGDVTLGDSEVLGRNEEDVVENAVGAGGRTLVVHADVALGKLLVVRAVR